MNFRAGAPVIGLVLVLVLALAQQQ